MRTNLEQGCNYKAQIALSGIKQMASNNDVADKLKAVGFTFVSVLGYGDKRVAKGKWSKATQEVEVPNYVSLIEKI